MIFPKPQDVELRAPRRGWTQRWNNLGQTQLLDERPAKLKTTIDYLRGNAPELAHGKPTTVIDLSPSTGALLEVARALGHQAFGILNQRSPARAEACSMLFERHGIELNTRGLGPYVSYETRGMELIERFGGDCGLICFRDHMFDALPYLLTRTDDRFRWRTDGNATNHLENFFCLMQQLLSDSGILLLTLPNLINPDVAHTMVREMASAEGLQLVRITGRQFKWRRI